SVTSATWLRLTLLPAGSSSGNVSKTKTFSSCFLPENPQFLTAGRTGPPPSAGAGGRVLVLEAGFRCWRPGSGPVIQPSGAPERQMETPLHLEALLSGRLVNHSLLLSATGDSSYRFGATFVGSKQAGPAEFFPVMVGDMDNSGSLNSQIIHQISSRIRSKVAFQTQQQKFVNWQGDAEFKGDDFTAAVTFGNPDVLAGSGIVIAHYLQSITPALALGGELVYHRRTGEEGAVVSLLGRYTGGNSIATLTLGSTGAHASYYHRANDQLQVGVEFEASSRTQDSSVTFGYQLDVPGANLQFKGSIDSNWVVGATLEKKLLPLPLSLVLCSFLNHQKNKFQCGFGITIG
uniref:Mitochondrial import receptor subunit TOM40 homolog n=1 Tax=Cyprinodon variegatus TaxID=28743 RepID=A0A3Q2E378_CYPVA